MMNYYLDWFENEFPEKIAKMLNADITDRKTLVMISAYPDLSEENGSDELSCLNKAGILFKDYYLINRGVSKEEAQNLIKKASAIFLLGGDTVQQNAFLNEYELIEPIKNSKAVILGTSAGAINMTAKWICSKYNRYDVEESSVYRGMNLNNFSFQPHLDIDYGKMDKGEIVIHELFKNELFNLSKEMNVYMTNKGLVRVMGGKIDIAGDVYLASHSFIHKLEETL